ncbi:hypothetical protein [Streptomyces sp. 8L]|uniref:hypothetical protein n=1 Tax=Streptomyces sp. 8L TaxID=2877242 RepID=UPI001CD55D53|nr:hypothetical protein [Streptomyces sp. 8L]MCA1223798.1 hypothetical protein [Streptomyces sp. 8L]
MSPSSARLAEPTGSGPARTGVRRDLLADAGARALIAAVAVVGTVLQARDGTLHTPWPPLLATWDPHIGPGTPAAVAVGAAAIAYGPGLAARVPWRALLALNWATATAWTLSLALVDGWHLGVAGRLTTRYEYLSGVSRFHDVGSALRGFTSHILLGNAQSWPAHIAGHPAGAVLTFVGLDHAGLGGGAWAALFCVVTGGSVAAAVLVALRALAGERTARRAAPFLALAPGAVWVGVSADGYFAAVAAWALALLALAATRTVRFPAVVAAASGLLLGWAVYLSYGLTLLAVPALAILLYARTARPLLPALAAFAAVVVAFTAAGFSWWTAYSLLVPRYYQGVGGDRPYAYWLFGDLGTVVVTAGLASVAGLRRAAGALPAAVRAWWANRTGAAATSAPDDGAPATGALEGDTPATGAPESGVPGGGAPSRGGAGAVAVLVCAFVLAILAADLSGMSKAETERIWLPFTLWLPAAAALLPARHARPWLAAQVVTALLVNHLLLTYW